MFPHQRANSLNAAYLRETTITASTTRQPPVSNLKHAQQHVSWSKTKDHCINCFFLAHPKINCTQKTEIWTRSLHIPKQLFLPSSFFSPSVTPTLHLLSFPSQSFRHLLSFPLQSFRPLFSPSVFPTHPHLFSFPLQSFLPFVFFSPFSHSYPSSSSFFPPSVVPTYPHLLSFPPQSFLPILIFFLSPLSRSYLSSSSFFSPSVIPTHLNLLLFSPSVVPTHPHLLSPSVIPTHLLSLPL